MVFTSVYLLRTDDEDLFAGRLPVPVTLTVDLNCLASTLADEDDDRELSKLF